MNKKMNATNSTTKTKKDTTDEKISKHFSELGKKSWESRKAKILDKTSKTIPNV